MINVLGVSLLVLYSIALGIVLYQKIRDLIEDEIIYGRDKHSWRFIRDVLFLCFLLILNIICIIGLI